jgi:DNA primase
MKAFSSFYSLDHLKRSIQPYEFYLREQGHSKAGLCPFHNDRNAGSFYFDIETGAYTCFSCGKKGGDIISFTQNKYDLNFKEALSKLRKEWGVYDY